MKNKPDLDIIRGLLFVYGIENTDNEQREEFIVSKNVNDEHSLSELFDGLTKPEFLYYKKHEQDWLINTLNYFLSANETFDSVFARMDTYFEDEVTDQRQFMRILRDCLTRYQAEASEKANEN